jgi:hypothetical protein
VANCKNCGKEIPFEEFGNDYCRACRAKIEADEAKTEYYRKRLANLEDDDEGEEKEEEEDDEW